MISLEFCTRTNLVYKSIRDRHYIPNNGTHGQQIHFIVYDNNELVGIISGASSVYGVESRDRFFNIPKDKQTKQDYYLPAIINNVVFRLEVHTKNLGTKILSKWRKTISLLWEEIYNVPVIGFETFIIENETRKGSMYKADNWLFVGETKGSTKNHSGLTNKSTRVETDIKMVYCRWIGGKEIIPTVKYISSWRGETTEEKERAKKINKIKSEYVGKIF
jgi:hypothetical protein